jgi:hypothetical protein
MEEIMPDVVSYLVAAMTAWVPVHAHAEPKEDTVARYDAIAHDAIQVAFDESEAPLFGGPTGRTQTALLMLAIASLESSYQKAVDDGTKVGDHGKSYCLMQIRVGPGLTADGWSGWDLVNDRTKCFRAGLHILRGSFQACRNLELRDRMSAYATGRCTPGEEKSRLRVGRALAWWDTHEPPTLTS